MTDQQLNLFRAKLHVEHVELGWKADKAALRLKKRLKREAKKHKALEPTHQLLHDARIIHAALLPLGASEALKLVEQQIAAFEANIDDVTYRYRLLSAEEIALKEMQVILLREKAMVVKAYLNSVEELMAIREAKQAVTSPSYEASSVQGWSREFDAADEKDLDNTSGLFKSGGFNWPSLRSLFDKALRRIPIPERVYAWR
ncbi:MAG: hypothetical protein P8H59_12150 [Flavobacteriales bacterium]|nr:hypothetical protein [Flavobacteriales bacterium]MDG1781699.1 hypothetical protein [Flavobacteriales bacterium]MDG2244874.1 hypothetical protein [Flavobacteriales bacterium]